MMQRLMEEKDKQGSGLEPKGAPLKRLRRSPSLVIDPMGLSVLLGAVKCFCVCSKRNQRIFAYKEDNIADSSNMVKIVCSLSLSIGTPISTECFNFELVLEKLEKMESGLKC
ncbi:hypothetical protein VNO77_20332 [Canavalia gladiata]|uniref:Uncharacterized protein n=1 Tax=Canavalia gladiata TaxID=3824 RepID=A0AAN9LU76_CANGL